jgi:hypothetical protein
VYITAGHHQATLEVEAELVSMLLQFITDASIGPKERRLIRSHVMKGKNAGRPRPSKRQPRDTSVTQHEASAPTQTGHQSEPVELDRLDGANPLDLKRILWNDLTLTSFPLPMNPSSRKITYYGTSAPLPLFSHSLSHLNATSYRTMESG